MILMTILSLCFLAITCVIAVVEKIDYEILRRKYGEKRAKEIMDS